MLVSITVDGEEPCPLPVAGEPAPQFIASQAVLEARICDIKRADEETINALADRDPTTVYQFVKIGDTICQIPRCRMCASGEVTPADHVTGNGNRPAGAPQPAYFSAFDTGGVEGTGIARRYFFIDTGKVCVGRSFGGRKGAPDKLRAYVRDGGTVEGDLPANWWWAHSVDVVCLTHFSGPATYYLRITTDSTTDGWDGDYIPSWEWQLWEDL